MKSVTNKKKSKNSKNGATNALIDATKSGNLKGQIRSRPLNSQTNRPVRTLTKPRTIIDHNASTILNLSCSGKFFTSLVKSKI